MHALQFQVDELILYKLALATSCGAVLGIERQLRGKPFGIRTSALICLGTALFVTLGDLLSGGPSSTSADPSRIIGQVITGVGFLGAGAIITRGGTIHGITSAAVVWVIAGIGACVGLGYAGVAIAVTGLAVTILIAVEQMERTLSVLQRGAHRRIARDEKDETTTPS